MTPPRELFEPSADPAALRSAVDAWLASDPPRDAIADALCTLALREPPARARPGAVTVELAPYEAWTPRAVPDPRTAGREALMPVLMEIVEAEGPVLAGRAFGLYTRAAGGKKLTGAAKAPLTGSAWRLKVQQRLEIGRDGATTIDNDDVLRPAGSPPVRVRELGPRTLEEVPLDEVAELMRRLRERGPTHPGDLKRAVLDTYGLVRLTARADEYLEQALERASG